MEKRVYEKVINLLGVQGDLRGRTSATQKQESARASQFGV
jgi:hypothetical protein